MSHKAQVVPSVAGKTSRPSPLLPHLKGVNRVDHARGAAINSIYDGSIEFAGLNGSGKFNGNGEFAMKLASLLDVAS